MPSPTVLRESITGLSMLAARQLALMLPDLGRVPPSALPMQDVIPEVVDTYGSAAAVLGSDWYDATREEQGVKGSFQAVPVDSGARPGTGNALALAAWVASYLQRPDADPARARQMLDGGVQRRIANAARYSVADNSIKDPQAHGWKRVTTGGCSFCRLLAAHGAVYHQSEAFGAHDHCGCVAVPAFKGRPSLVEGTKPTTEAVSDADRARTRDWVAANIH